MNGLRGGGSQGEGYGIADESIRNRVFFLASHQIGAVLRTPREILEMEGGLDQNFPGVLLTHEGVNLVHIEPLDPKERDHLFWRLWPVCRRFRSHRGSRNRRRGNVT